VPRFGGAFYSRRLSRYCADNETRLKQSNISKS
jgi:hypothetical protein